MTPELQELVRPHRGKVALLDSNVLLLNRVAKFDPRLVGDSYKRLSSFQPIDVALLDWLLGHFSSVATTPHVLTEVSNLSNQMPSWIKDQWFPWFGDRLGELAELGVPCKDLGRLESFFKFGLTDSGLSHFAGECVVITNEFPLTGFLESKNLPVINFTHLRQARLLA